MGDFAQAAPQGGKHRLGIGQAQFGRQAVGDMPGESGEYQAQEVGIAFLNRGVEDRARFRRKAGIGLWGEGGVVAGGES